MRFMDRYRLAMREGGYSEATIKLYVGWVVRFIHYHQLRHPAEMTAAEVSRFLEHLAIERAYSAKTQNQALQSLRCLYDLVLDAGIDAELASLRARTPRTLPETAGAVDIKAVVDRLAPKYRLMAFLIYGGGLGLAECVKLRVHNIDFSRQSILLAKRETILPQRIRDEMRQQVILASHWPGNVDGYLFPSGRLHEGRCWHVSPSNFQKAMKAACAQAGAHRRITARVLRHSFARHLIAGGYDVRTVQQLMGHSDVRTTMVYQRMKDTRRVRSPLDE